jgi:hypothetical protein
LFSGPVVFILEKCDKIVNMVCPFLAGSVIVGSLWWTAEISEFGPLLDPISK